MVVALIIIGGAGDSGDHANAGAQTIVVTKRQAPRGIPGLRYRKHAIVDLTVTSDTADEAHIHGYDLQRMS